MDIGHLIGYVELDDSGVAKGAQSAQDRIKELGSSGKGLATLAGVGIGAALGAGLLGALDADSAGRKLTAQLDLSAADSERLGGIAGSLYSNAYGENLGDVNDALRSLIQNVEGMGDATDAELEGIAAKTISVAETFDQDLGGVTRAIGTLMRTGLAPSAEAALDLITRGFQNGTNVADDLLDTFSEYGTQFRKLGLDGPTALGLLGQGLKGGARDADIVADSLKELSIRAIDGSETTAAGFEAIGLNAREMGAAFAAGGTTARDALDLTLDRLRAVPDPAARSAAAVGLFGTQAEDLGDALFALDPSAAAAGLGELEGAAARVDETVGGGVAVSITELGRKLQTFATDNLGGAVLPVLGELVQTASGVLIPALDATGAVVGTVVGAFAGLPEPIQQTVLVLGALVAFRGPVADAFDTLRTAGTNALETVQLRALYARDAISGGAGLTGAIGGVGSAAAGAVRGGLGGLVGMLGGPLGLAIAGVSIGLPLLTSLFGENSDTADDAARANSDLAQAIKDSSGAITANVRAAAAKEAQDKGILDVAERAGISTERVTAAILGNKEAYDEVSAALKAYRDQQASTGSDGAAAIFDEYDEADDARTALEGLTRTIPETLEGQRQLATASGVGADAQGDLAEGLDETTGAADEQADALESLSDLFDRLTGGTQDLGRAQITVQDGLADLADTAVAVAEGFGSGTQASRDATTAVLDQIDAVEDLSTAMFENTGSSERARDVYQEEIGALRERLVELGYSEEAVDAILAKYAKIPEEEWTDIAQPGMAEAQEAADLLRDKVLAIPDGKTVRTSALTEEAKARLGELGLTVTTLPDGTVEVSAATAEAARVLANFVNERRVAYIETQVVGSTARAATAQAAFRANGGAIGGIVREYAAGGIELTPMAGGLAQVVAPGTWRVIGDRVVDDEFYIPDNDDPRSVSLGLEWARRRGWNVVPMAVGGIAGTTATGTAGGSDGGGRGPAVLFTGPVTLRDQRDAAALADDLEWRRRTRGRRR